MNGLPQNALLNFRLEFPKSDLTIYHPSGISEIFCQMVSTPGVDHFRKVIFGHVAHHFRIKFTLYNGQLFKTQTLLLSGKSEQQESLERVFMHHTGTQKIPSVSHPSNSSGKRFQINCKMPVYEEKDSDCDERLGKLWCCLRSNRKQDSTWSWVVCFSAAICNALNLGFVLSFGVLFPVLLDYFNETKERTGE